MIWVKLDLGGVCFWFAFVRLHLKSFDHSSKRVSCAPRIVDMGLIRVRIRNVPLCL